MQFIRTLFLFSMSFYCLGAATVYYHLTGPYSGSVYHPKYIGLFTEHGEPVEHFETLAPDGCGTVPLGYSPVTGCAIVTEPYNGRFRVGFSVDGYLLLSNEYSGPTDGNIKLLLDFKTQIYYADLVGDLRHQLNGFPVSIQAAGMTKSVNSVKLTSSGLSFPQLAGSAVSLILPPIIELSNSGLVYHGTYGLKLEEVDLGYKPQMFPGYCDRYPYIKGPMPKGIEAAGRDTYPPGKEDYDFVKFTNAFKYNSKDWVQPQARSGNFINTYQSYYETYHDYAHDPNFYITSGVYRVDGSIYGVQRLLHMEEKDQDFQSVICPNHVASYRPPQSDYNAAVVIHPNDSLDNYADPDPVYLERLETYISDDSQSETSISTERAIFSDDSRHYIAELFGTSRVAVNDGLVSTVYLSGDWGQLPAYFSSLVYWEEKLSTRGIWPKILYPRPPFGTPKHYYFFRRETGDLKSISRFVYPPKLSFTPLHTQNGLTMGFFEFEQNGLAVAGSHDRQRPIDNVQMPEPFFNDLPNPPATVVFPGSVKDLLSSTAEASSWVTSDFADSASFVLDKNSSVFVSTYQTSPKLKLEYKVQAISDLRLNAHSFYGDYYLSEVRNNDRSILNKSISPMGCFWLRHNGLRITSNDTFIHDPDEECLNEIVIDQLDFQLTLIDHQDDGFFAIPLAYVPLEQHFQSQESVIDSDIGIKAVEGTSRLRFTKAVTQLESYRPNRSTTSIYITNGDVQSIFVSPIQTVNLDRSILRKSNTGVSHIHAVDSSVVDVEAALVTGRDSYYSSLERASFPLFKNLNNFGFALTSIESDITSADEIEVSGNRFTIRNGEVNNILVKSSPFTIANTIADSVNRLRETTISGLGVESQQQLIFEKVLLEDSIVKDIHTLNLDPYTAFHNVTLENIDTVNSCNDGINPVLFLDVVSGTFKIQTGDDDQDSFTILLDEGNTEAYPEYLVTYQSGDIVRSRNVREQVLCGDIVASNQSNIFLQAGDKLHLMCMSSFASEVDSPFVKRNTSQAGFSSPVSTINGAYNRFEDDIVVKSRSLPVNFSRHYMSSDSSFGPLGPKWQPSGFVRLFHFVDTSERLEILYSQGNTTILYPKNGRYESSDGSLWVESFSPLQQSVEVHSITGLKLDFIDIRSSSSPDSPNYVLVREKHIGAFHKLYEYNSKAQIVRIGEVRSDQTDIATSDPQIQISYNTLDLIDTVSNNGRETHTYSYDAFGRLTSVHNGYDIIRRYSYEDIRFPNSLTKVTGINENVIANIQYNSLNKVSYYDQYDLSANYIYGESGNILEVIKPRESGTVSITVDFDRDVLVSQMTQSDGTFDLKHSYVWDENRQLSSATYENGFENIFEYNEDGTLARSKSLFSSATAGMSQEQKFALIPGLLTEYEYTVVNGSPKVSYTHVTQTGSPKVSSHYTYTENGLPKTYSIGSIETEFRYNSESQIESIWRHQYTTSGHISESRVIKAVTYDSNGYPDISTSHVNDSSGQPIQTDFDFDTFGNLLKVTSPKGIISQFAYNSNNDLTGITIYDYQGLSPPYTINQVYDSFGRLKRREYGMNRFVEYEYDKFSRPVLITDQAGRYTRFYYNSDGLLKDIEGSLNEIYSFEYNAFGNLIRTVDPEGFSVTREYDFANRLKSVTDQNNSQYQFQHDPLDRVNHIQVLSDSQPIYSKNQTFNSVGLLTSESYNNGLSKLYSFDPSQRLKEVTITSRDLSQNQVTSFDFDIFDRIIKTNFQGKEYSTSFNDSVNQVTYFNELGDPITYQFDRDGLPSLKQNKNGEATLYSYDYLGRQTKQTFSSGRYEVTSYDLNSNITSKTKYSADHSLLIESQYSYNQSDYLTNVFSIDHLSGQTLSISYEHDPLGNVIAKMEEPSGISSFYDYNKKSQLTFVSHPFLHREITYVYDGKGYKAQVFVEDTLNRTVYIQTYNYDSLGRVTEVYSDHYGSLSIRYFDDGQPGALNLRKEVTYHQLGIEANYFVDTFERLARIEYKINDTVSFSYDYTYDSFNRIQSKTITTSQGSTWQDVYSYIESSGLNGPRLTSVSSDLGNIDYTFDKNDNLLTRSDTSNPNYNVQFEQEINYKDRLKGVSFPSYGSYSVSINELGQTTKAIHVKNGDTIVRIFNYDPLSRLQSVSVQTFSSSPLQNQTSSLVYSYMPGSDLKWKNSANTMTATTAFSKNSLVLYDGVQELEHIDELFQISKLQVGFPGTYDMRAGFAEFGPQETSQYAYFSDHQMTVNAVADSQGTTEVVRFTAHGGQHVSIPGESEALFGFNGRPYDSLSHVYYYRGRHYDPCLGRFLNEDPMQHGENWYGYMSDPVNYIDPSGYARRTADNAFIFDDGFRAESHMVSSYYSTKGILLRNYEVTLNEAGQQARNIFDKQRRDQYKLQQSQGSLQWDFGLPHSNVIDASTSGDGSGPGCLLGVLSVSRGFGFRRQSFGRSGGGSDRSVAPNSVDFTPDDWAKMSGQLRDASKGKGNFGLGSGTREQADAMGKAWVGPNYKVASDGTTLISNDGLRQYRPPKFKPRLGKYQANFERRFEGQKTKQWQGNGHLDIED